MLEIVIAVQSENTSNDSKICHSTGLLRFITIDYLSYELRLGKTVNFT